MFYATGGLAWGTNDDRRQHCRDRSSCALQAQQHAMSAGRSARGLEWALLDNWTAKVEYLYLDLGNENYFSSGRQLASASMPISTFIP